MNITNRRKRFFATTVLIVFWFFMAGLAIFAAFCGRESWTVIRGASLFLIISVGFSIFYIQCSPDNVNAGRFFSLVLTVPACVSLLAVVGIFIYAWLTWQLPVLSSLYTVFQVCFVANLIGIPLWICHESDSAG